MSAHVVYPSRLNMSQSWGYRGAGQPKLHLTRRGKLVLGLLGLLALVCVLLLAGAKGGASSDYEPTATTTHLVTSGDTMWQVASAVTQPGQDVRDVIYAIQKLNHLDSSSLQVGQVLVIPLG